MNSKKTMSGIFDIAVLGGGPAGLTAAIYALRARMKVLLIERACFGGQMATTDIIENYPGFPGGVTGSELSEKMTRQAKDLGLTIAESDVTGITPKKNEKDPCTVTTADNKTFQALAIVVATGAHWNKLGVPGEEELAGRGVSYCATCDGPLYRQKEVVVVGGGNTALGDAIFLRKFVKKATLVHRRDRLRATKILQEQAFADKNIDLCLSSVVMKILGKDRVEGVAVKHVETGKESTIKADGVFIFIGIQPNSKFLQGIVDVDAKGYITADNDMKTSADGIFACGDVREKSLRQIVTAAGEGAAAAYSAQHYVERLQGTEYV
ncbi:MAG: thioredoxin-disulfide reductase [Candidatus Omnitrophota bacterium]